VGVDRLTWMVGGQPANRDIGAGTFFLLTPIRARKPQATVVIYRRITSFASVESLFKRCADWFGQLSAMRIRWCCLALHRIAENWNILESNQAQNSVRSGSVRYAGHCSHEAVPSISDERHLPTQA